MNISRQITAPFTTGYVDVSKNIRSTDPYYDIDLSGNTTYSYKITPYTAGDISYSDISMIYTSNVQAARDLSAIFYDTSGIQIQFTYPKNSYSSTYYYQLNALYNGVTTSISGSSSPLLVNGLSGATLYSCSILSYLDNVLKATSDNLDVTTLLGPIPIIAIPVPNKPLTFFSSYSQVVSGLTSPYTYANGTYDIYGSTNTGTAYHWKVFNDDNNQWQNNQYLNGLYTGIYKTYNTTNGTINGDFVQIKLPYSFNLNTYKIQGNAIDFYILGSNNLINWTILDTKTATSNSTLTTYNIANSNYYTYHRFIVTKVTAGQNLGISRWFLSGLK